MNRWLEATHSLARIVHTQMAIEHGEYLSVQVSVAPDSLDHPFKILDTK